VRDAEATRKRLLEAAKKEFAAHGFGGARLKNIAGAAGVQAALIYHYFASKSELYSSVLDAAFAETSSLSFQILEQEHDLESMIAAFVDMLLRFNARHRYLLAILRHSSEDDSMAENVLEDLMGQRVDPVIRAVGARIQQMKDAGVVRQALDPDDLIIAGLAQCSYPFADTVFLGACLPKGLVKNSTAFESRKHAIVDCLVRYARS
jgi:AcrR family transcriptional regulator